MNTQTERPAPTCPHCGKPMHFDGVQKMEPLGYQYDLYTCQTDGCFRKDFTYTYFKRAIEEK